MEIKSSNVNKGLLLCGFIAKHEYDFVFSIEDDWTDEFMFQEFYLKTLSHKGGRQKTQSEIIW